MFSKRGDVTHCFVRGGFGAVFLGGDVAQCFPNERFLCSACKRDDIVSDGTADVVGVVYVNTVT